MLRGGWRDRHRPSPSPRGASCWPWPPPSTPRRPPGWCFFPAPPPAWPFSAPTCWATRCATPWTRASAAAEPPPGQGTPRAGTGRHRVTLKPQNLCVGLQRRACYYAHQEVEPMKHVTIELPPELIELLGSEEEARKEAKVALVLDLVRRGKLSRAKAAESPVISAWDLPALLGQYRIPW